MKLSVKLAILFTAAFITDLAVLLCFYLSIIKDGGDISVNEINILLTVQIVTTLVLFAVIAFVLNKIILKPVKSLTDELAENADTPFFKDDGGFEDIRRGIEEYSDALHNEKQKQSRIIASISHDIKTPLTSVIGYAEMLQKPDISEERREKYSKIIHSKAHKIRNMINEFDDYLSGELGKHPNMQTLNVRKTCEEFTLSLREQFPADKLNIDLLCTSDGYISADPDRLYRVFMNAVSNSISHGQRQTLNFHIAVTQENGEFVFVLTDDGAGVTQEQLKCVFEPMYTSDQSRSVAGLGLAICKEIISSFNGEIYAKSEKDKYFSLVFKLPVCKDTE